jgi:hypothetical protein
MRHDAGNALKDQGNSQEFMAPPLNPLKCGPHDTLLVYIAASPVVPAGRLAAMAGSSNSTRRQCPEHSLINMEPVLLLAGGRLRTEVDVRRAARIYFDSASLHSL